MQRKITKMLLLCLIVLSVVTLNGITASAKQKDVTKTFKNKKKMEKMLDDTWWYVWSEFAFNMKKNESKTINFSNAANRRAVMVYYLARRYNVVYQEKLTTKKMNKASNNLFGCNTAKKDCRPGVITGDDSMIQIKIDKIFETGKNTYSVQCTFNAVEKFGGSKYSKVGTYTYYVKADKKSSYGYVLKKMKIKKDGKMPKWYN